MDGRGRIGVRVAEKSATLKGCTQNDVDSELRTRRRTATTWVFGKPFSPKIFTAIQCHDGLLLLGDLCDQNWCGCQGRWRANSIYCAHLAMWMWKRRLRHINCNARSIIYDSDCDRIQVLTSITNSTDESTCGVRFRQVEHFLQSRPLFDTFTRMIVIENMMCLRVHWVDISCLVQQIKQSVPLNVLFLDLFWHTFCGWLISIQNEKIHMIDDQYYLSQKVASDRIPSKSNKL